MGDRDNEGRRTTRLLSWIPVQQLNSPGWRIGATVVVVAGWAAVTAWWTPRGPISNVEGVTTVLVSFAVGGLAGYATRSRYAMVLAPVTFAVVVELLRLGVDGPTVDGFHVSTYGLIAFVVGRGIHGLLSLLPMVLGAALGAGLARRRSRPRAKPRLGLVARRAVAGTAGLAVIALTVAVARPGTTDSIKGPDGRRLPGSIAELTRVPVHGYDLGLMIRGHDANAPVVLFLAGGPGGSEVGAMRRHLSAIERDFVVVTWDQRGTGRSYGALDASPTYTLDRAVADTITVADYLRGRFDKPTIYLLGQSWGSILGVLAVQRAPDRFAAFVGTGQMVSPAETDQIFYRDTLAWARHNGNQGVARQLDKIGPPPYENILDYEPALSYEHDVYPYDHAENSEGEGGFSENLFVKEYTLLEQVHALAGFLDTFAALYPQIQHIDLRRSATRLAVPVHLIQGAREPPGRADLAAEWLRGLEAPATSLTVLDNSGHRPLFEQPEQFRDALLERVLGGAT